MVVHFPRPTWVVVVCLESQPLSDSQSIYYDVPAFH